ncbi:hemicentin-1-like isoform X1 [Clytia hemisphaerica]|uniref:hemicentin-1-like isoform X1 n=1 Tax=Clytia hemisphaerica TaxID=252671 RepID=UPI0034D6E9D5
MRFLVCSFFLLQIINVSFCLNLTFPETPGDVIYGYYSRSVSLRWGYVNGSLKTVSFTSTNGIIAEGQFSNNVFTPNVKAVYQGRVTLTFVEDEKAVVLEMNDLKYEDEGTIDCTVLRTDLQRFLGSSMLKVITPQNISITPLSNEASEFSPFTIKCIVQSRPVSNITWFKAANQIEADSGEYNISDVITTGDISTIESTLSVLESRESDTSQYRCVATTPDGRNLEATSDLVIQYKPVNTTLTFKLKSLFSSNTTFEGDDVTITCHATAFPPPMYAIYNSTSLIARSRDGVVNLTVSNHHDDVYRCEPSNSVGAGPVVYRRLDVYAHPEVISSSPQNQQAAVGSQSELFCQVRADPEATVEWIFPQVDVIGKGFSLIETLLSNENGLVTKTSTLRIHVLTLNDTGEYVCLVNNTHAQDNRTFSLQVQYGPNIVSFPTDPYGTVEGAQNVRFECVVHSNPVSTIDWFINEKLYNQSSPHLYDVSNETTINSQTNDAVVRSNFHVKNVRKEDIARYTCQATNNVIGRGEMINNQSAMLIISHKPYFLSNPPPLLAVRNGTQAVLNCSVQGFPSPLAWWSSNITLDEERVTNTTVVEEATGKTIVTTVLTISDLREEDFGLFTCHGVEGNETVQIQTVLKVAYVPKMENFKSTLDIEEGKMRYLECAAIGYPPPQIKWFFAHDQINFVEITDKAVATSRLHDGYSSHVTSVLDYGDKNISRVDTGSYNCQVSNSEASLDNFLNVTVQFAPELSMSGVEEVKMNDPNTFQCIVESNPQSDVKWFKNDEEISAFPKTVPINNLTLVRKDETFKIQSAQPDDMAVYKCEAINEVLGVERKVVQSIDFKVRYAPIITATPLEQGVAAKTKLVLSCAAHAYPAIEEYRWRYNGNAIQDFNQEEYVIQSVDEQSEGIYQCQPMNAEGLGGRIVHNITVIVKPVFTTFPTCVHHEQQDLLQCHFEGSGIPDPTHHWRVFGQNDVIANQSALNISLSKDTEGNYSCVLSNSHATIEEVLNIEDFIPRNSEWSTWSSCNVNCGEGERNRTRKCLIKNCLPGLLEKENCNISCPTTGAIKADWHKDWYIAFWVAIPLLAILLIICFVWCGKKRRSEKKAVFVPINRDLAPAPQTGKENGIHTEPVRKMSTQREIYLPDRVPMSALNNGYIPDQHEPKEIPDKYETDSIEVEMHFQEEIPEAQSPPPRPALDPVDAVVEVENEAYDDESEADVSFPASTFNHLNSNLNNDSFMSLYDTGGGPPKPPRKQDSSFMGGQSDTASLF